MTHSGYSSAAIATVEGYLGQLDTLAAAINSQRSIEGSTLLPELRREYRRFVALMPMPPYRLWGCACEYWSLARCAGSRRRLGSHCWAVV